MSPNRQTSTLIRPRITLLFIIILIFILCTSAVLFTFETRHVIPFSWINNSGPKNRIPVENPQVSKTDAPNTTTPSRIEATHMAQDRVSSSTSEPSGILEPSKWYFDTARDEKVFTLDDSQCASAFSGLFTDIERATKYRKSIGHVTPEDLDLSWQEDGGIRAMVFDQQVFSPLLFSIILNIAMFSLVYYANIRTNSFTLSNRDSALVFRRLDPWLSSMPSTGQLLPRPHHFQISSSPSPQSTLRIHSTLVTLYGLSLVLMTKRRNGSCLISGTGAGP